MNMAELRIRDTFHVNYAGGYTAVTNPDGPTNPVYVICTQAISLIDKDETLELPVGLTRDALSSFSYMAGFSNREFNIQYHQAVEVAEIGKQLLQRVEDETLQLGDEQVGVIKHLIETVSK